MTTKIISGVVLILILGGAGFFYYSESSSVLSSSSILPGGGSLTAGTSTATDPNRDQTLQRLNRLEDVSINTEFLSGQVFESFENFGISIKSQSVGRSNPFTPPQVRIPATITENRGGATTTTSSQQSATSSANVTPTTSLDQLPPAGNPTSTTPSDTSTGSE